MSLKKDENLKKIVVLPHKTTLCRINITHVKNDLKYSITPFLPHTFYKKLITNQLQNYSNTPWVTNIHFKGKPSTSSNQAIAWLCAFLVLIQKFVKTWLLTQFTMILPQQLPQ